MKTSAYCLAYAAIVVLLLIGAILSAATVAVSELAQAIDRRTFCELD